MPKFYKKRYRRYKKAFRRVSRFRRRVNKRRFRRGHRPKVQRLKGLTGLLTDATFTKMRYVKAYAVGQNGYAVWVWRGNSIYDPDYAVGGGRPTGAQVYDPLYWKYTVLGSSIKMKVLNTGASVLKAMLRPQMASTTAAPGATSKLEELPDTRVKWIGNNVGGNDVRTIKHYASTKKQYAKKPLDDEFNGDVGGLGIGSNPLNEWYWSAYLFNPVNVGTGSISAYVEFWITYYVKYTQPKRLAFATEDNTDLQPADGPGDKGD